MKPARFISVMIFPLIALFLFTSTPNVETSRQSNGESYTPSISPDGRYVAFSSFASNLVRNDKNNHADIFLYDRETKSTKLITQGFDGSPADGDSIGTTISHNGRVIGFSSMATNLVGETVSEGWHLFTYDLETGLISLDDAEQDSEVIINGAAPVTSADGQTVAFIRSDGDIRNLYTYEKATDQLRVVTAIQKMPFQLHDEPPVISGDGRFIGFVSALESLVPFDRNDTWDVFLYDRQTEMTQLITITLAGIQANGSSSEIAISDDGRYIVFQSNASNLIDDDTNGVSDIFMVDRETGEISRIS